MVSTFLVSYFPNILPSVDSMVEDTPLTIVSIDDDESVSSIMFGCSLVSSTKY